MLDPSSREETESLVSFDFISFHVIHDFFNLHIPCSNKIAPLQPAAKPSSDQCWAPPPEDVLPPTSFAPSGEWSS